MGFIKRAFYSMKYRKGHNIFLMIAYTAIFALTLAILLVYLSMSAQVDWLQKSLGCAVTLRGPSVAMPGYRDSFLDIFEDDAQTFIDSPYVEDYNIVGRVDNVDFEGFLPVVREGNEGMYEYQTAQGKRFGYIGDGCMAPVTRSAEYDAFTVYGFTLVEGRHFTEADESAVIITKQLAERNGIHIGDQITFSTNNFAKVNYLTEDQYQYATLTVVGLMDTPNFKEAGYRTSTVFHDPYNFVVASYASAGIVSNMYANPPQNAIQWVTVYLHSPDELDVFLTETQEKLEIQRIVGSKTDFGMEGISTEEGQAILDRYRGGSPFYDLFLDDEWYDMVAKPAESVRNLMGIFLIVVLVGSAVVLALVVLLSLRGRKREFGILLAMGEPAQKVVSQIFIEVFLSLLLAAVLGSYLGLRVLVPLAEDYSSQVLVSQAREQQTDISDGLKDSDFFYSGEMPSFRDDLQYRSFRTMRVVKSVPYEAGPEVYGAYFTLDFAMVVLILLIQMMTILRMKPARILTRRE